MQQVTCHYCHNTLWLFQAFIAEVTAYTPDMTPLTEEVVTCYWCALKEGGDETNRE